MPAINFRKEFAEKVRSGEKRQTIRPRRADGRNPQPGQTLYLYTGQRTKSCQKLKEVECISCEPIVIDHDALIVRIKDLTILERVEMARADGFHDFYEFIQFFRDRYGLPFYGFLIKW